MPSPDPCEKSRVATGQFARLHSNLFGPWEAKAPLIFQTRPVLRDPDPSTRIPDDLAPYTVLECEELRDFMSPSLPGILVRDEYRVATQAAYECSVGGDARLLSLGVNNQLDCGVSCSVVVDNPFLHQLDTQSSRCNFTVLGDTVGKRMWMYYVLVLRMLAGRPTVLLSETDEGHLVHYVSTPEGALCVQDGEDGSAPKLELSQDTWYLVLEPGRANIDILWRLPHTVVTKSLNEMIRSVDGMVSEVFYMKRWTAQELIAGQMLQPPHDPPLTERNVIESVGKYGPSLTNAFDQGDAFQERSKLEDLACNRHSPEDLRDGPDIFLAPDPALFTTIPGRSRGQCDKIFVSRHIHDIFYNTLARMSKAPASELYDWLLDHGDNAAARYLLEDNVRHMLSQGGEWEIYSLSRARDSAGCLHYTHASEARQSTPGRCLRLGVRPRARWMLLPDRGQDKRSLLPPDAPAKNRVAVRKAFAPLVTCAVALGQIPMPQDCVYYHFPRGAGGRPPEFDGFVYEQATRTAVIFQVVAARRREVRSAPLDFLRRRGEKVLYVALVPGDFDMDITIPPEVDGFDEVYALPVMAL